MCTVLGHVPVEGQRSCWLCHRPSGERKGLGGSGGCSWGMGSCPAPPLLARSLLSLQTVTLPVTLC